MMMLMLTSGRIRQKGIDYVLAFVYFNFEGTKLHQFFYSICMVPESGMVFMRSGVKNYSEAVSNHMNTKQVLTKVKRGDID